VNTPGPRKVRVPRASSTTSMSFAFKLIRALSSSDLPAGKFFADGPVDRTTRTAAEEAVAVASKRPAAR
jgi:hypothetical protein